MRLKLPTKWWNAAKISPTSTIYKMMNCCLNSLTAITFLENNVMFHKNHQNIFNHHSPIFPPFKTIKTISVSPGLSPHRTSSFHHVIPGSYGDTSFAHVCVSAWAADRSGAVSAPFGTLWLGNSWNYGEWWYNSYIVIVVCYSGDSSYR